MGKKCHLCDNEAFIAVRILKNNNEAYFCETCFTERWIPSLVPIVDGIAKGIVTMTKGELK